MPMPIRVFFEPVRDGLQTVIAIFERAVKKPDFRFWILQQQFFGGSHVAHTLSRDGLTGMVTITVPTVGGTP